MSRTSFLAINRKAIQLRDQIVQDQQAANKKSDHDRFASEHQCARRGRCADVNDRAQDSYVLAHLASIRAFLILPNLFESVAIITGRRTTRSEPKAMSPRFIVPTPDLVVPNLKSFPSAESAYRAGMSLRAGIGRCMGMRYAVGEQFCKERGLTDFNTASTSDPTKGGYTAPDEVSSAILVNMSRIGVTRRLATIVPMSGGRATVRSSCLAPRFTTFRRWGR